jgi:phytoene dehydrogenase-like protein
MKWLGVNTPVRNLYLTGTDAVSPGIMGALMGGVVTASRLLGPFGFFRVMRAASR